MRWNGADRHDLWSSVERPVFVVGAPRSGTTLLRNLLSSHSNMAISPETHFMRLADQFDAACRAEPHDFEMFWSALARHLQLRATSVDLARCRALLDATGARDFRAVFAALLAVQATQAGKPIGGEKTPGNEHYLGRLFAWFPGARVILVYRDPRACAASWLDTPAVIEQLRPSRLTAPLVPRARWRHVAFKAVKWNETCRIARAWREDSRFASASYEGLVETPAAELERLCAFLGERFEPGMVDNRAPTMIAPDKAGIRWREWTLEHERRAAQPISRGSLARWRQRLSAAEIGIVEGVCQRGMSELGYVPTLDAAARATGRACCRWVMRADALERSARLSFKAALRAGIEGKHANAPARALASRLAGAFPFA